MSPQEPATSSCPPTVWRIAVAGRGESFSEISAAEADSPGGNRFDVPGGGVLYGCTVPLGCFYEVLSRFRVALPGRTNAAAEAASLDTGYMSPGSVPREWRLNRSKFQVSVSDPLPFLDIEHQQTRAFLRQEIGDFLAECDAPDLDVSDVRGPNRRLTRAIARWAYLHTDEQGEFAYSGVRYLSRHNDLECWAIFDGTKVKTVRQEPIDTDDRDLRAAADLWDLRIN